MRICIHSCWDIHAGYIGGTERFLVHIAKEFARLGHSPFIVCPSVVSYKQVEGIPVYGVLPLEYLENSNYTDFEQSGFLLKQFKHKNITCSDLINIGRFVTSQIEHFCCDAVFLNSFLLAAFCRVNVPCVVMNHESPEELCDLIGGRAKSLLHEIRCSGASVLGAHSAYLTPSTYYARKYTEILGIQVSGCALGVSLEDFPLDTSRRAPRKPYGIIDNTINVLLPSRFRIHQKGHDIALQVCKSLIDEGWSCNFTASGLKAHHRSELKKFQSLARDIGILSNVKVESYYDMKDAYLNADVVISPERYCSYGLAVSEALSSGVPCVLSAIPTYVEIADGYSHAILCEVDSVESFSKGIKYARRLDYDTVWDESCRFRINNDLSECAKTLLRFFTHWDRVEPRHGTRVLTTGQISA